MFLDFIEITNFRPFYGTQRINFGYNDEENLTIILANNGSGKTSLVNAFTWCLYGDELHDVRDKSEPRYNLRAAAEAEEEVSSGAEVLVSVKIRFYYFEEDEGESCAAYGLLAICVFIVVLGLEIAVLVIFINDYQILDLLAIIGYFIQWIPFIVLIIVIIVFQCK